MQRPAFGCVELPGQDIPPPAVSRFSRFRKGVARAARAEASPHQALDRAADANQGERLSRRGKGGVLEWKAAVVAVRFERRLRRGGGGVSAIDESFEQTVGRKPICAVQAAGSHLSGSP